METLNSTPEQTESAPAPVVAPAAEIPQAEAAPVAQAAPAAPAAPAPVKLAPLGTVELPKTTGKTPGGWNRFAGYDPKEAKNKKNDNRGGNKGRR